MSNYPDAAFLTSADSLTQFVADAGTEVAFAGRSNAGKSSAINVIVNRKQFARVSKTPGRTQLVNFFRLSGDKRLVDLPGYGYAKVSESMRRHWKSLMEDYFSQRRSLAGLFLIVDVRRGLVDFDLVMLEYAEQLGIPVHLLLTKADKLKRGQAARQFEETRRSLAGRAGVQLFSSLNRQGVDQARGRLNEMLGGHVNTGDTLA
ncbi:MAG: ribosome biogenesis GTP-binding protein YihA/YsxC [Pseudomonadota bacterium]